MEEVRKHADSLFEDAFGRFGKSPRFGGLAADLSLDPSASQ